MSKSPLIIALILVVIVSDSHAVSFEWYRVTKIRAGWPIIPVTARTAQKSILNPDSSGIYGILRIKMSTDFSLVSYVDDLAAMILTAIIGDAQR